ncbi:MAG: hypothetical protein Q8L14_37580 [Myxococcales bacterium]|nr:hypothetical protein [Myxococcales bacterium]
MSQPALSLQIAQPESALGVQLFDRDAADQLVEAPLKASSYLAGHCFCVHQFSTTKRCPASSCGYTISP